MVVLIVLIDGLGRKDANGCRGDKHNTASLSNVLRHRFDGRDLDISA